jgi:hypothetical protein
MSKILTIPVMPDPKARLAKRGKRTSDVRYVDGQKLIVEAIKYLAQSDPEQNKDAVSLLSEHFRTQFRMSDHPIS